jgi:hypothetical protein
MESKINQLLRQWPNGTVATTSWLNGHGVSRQLARRYTTSGWLQPMGHGAFLRAGDPPMEWFGAVYALQTQLKLTLHPGAGTALSLNGLGQNLPLGDKEVVTLFSDRRERLPAWFTRYAWRVRLAHHTPTLFGSSEPGGLTEVTQGAFSLRVSAPERAILELLHLATTNDAITHAVELMSGLSTLRPQVLQTLLEDCRSVKVKRLFLWAAESAGHEWFNRLTVASVDLGKGKRSLFRGGRFDPKYQITVPKQEDAAHV